MANKSEYYVSNKQFYREITVYLCARERRLEQGLEPQEIPPEIIEKIMKIARRLATKPNFRNYTYVEEMISDGLENSIRYIAKFNPEKYDNPFSYFTTICYNQFRQRIKKEQRQSKTKTKCLERSGLDDTNNNSSVQEHDSDENFTNEYMENIQEEIGFRDEEERKQRIYDYREGTLNESFELDFQVESPLDRFME